MVRTTTAGALAAVFVFGVCCLEAQAAPAADPQQTLQQFFDEIVKARSAQPPKCREDVERRTSGAPVEEISKALPTIMAAIQNDNEDIVRCTGIALIVISIRGDSAALLRPYISDLTGLLHSDRDYLRRSSLAMLAMLKPSLPPEAVPGLLEFVNESNSDEETQVVALSILLRAKPADEGVIQATEKFMSRSLDSSTRVTALNAIHTSLVKDIRVERIVLGELNDPHPGIQLAAISALDRMGPEALTKGQLALTRLLKSEDEHVAVAARAALARIAPPLK